VANIEITAVEMADTWATGASQSVDVKIDNHESVGPVGWGPVVCSSDGIWNTGHMSDVILRIEDADTGTVVWEASKGKCIPVERPSTSLGANATVHFEPSVDSAGTYVVTAEVQVRGDNGTDTSDRYPLTVGAGGSDLPPSGDERGAGLFPGADVPVDDVLADPIGAMADNPALALGAVLGLLIVLRPYASLGASATG